jgi:Domain of unknown function (DUF4440)
MNAIRVILICSFLVAAAAVAKEPATTSDNQTALYDEIAAADSELFRAANGCDLVKLGSMVDDGLEFYHDKAGLMVGKQLFLNSVKNNTCGVMIRELVQGSLEVYPVKGFGAIEVGVHRFHHPGHEKEWRGARELGMTRFLDPGAAEWPAGQAKFLHIWRKEQTGWTLVRVVSYAH